MLSFNHTIHSEVHARVSGGEGNYCQQQVEEENMKQRKNFQQKTNNA